MTLKKKSLVNYLLYLIMKKIEVVAAILQRDGAYFATQRGYGEFEGMWEFPGGKIEEGETPQEALVREIREELETEIAEENYEIAWNGIANPPENAAAITIIIMNVIKESPFLKLPSRAISITVAQISIIAAKPAPAKPNT